MSDKKRAHFSPGFFLCPKELFSHKTKCLVSFIEQIAILLRNDFFTQEFGDKIKMSTVFYRGCGKSRFKIKENFMSYKKKKCVFPPFFVLELITCAPTLPPALVIKRPFLAFEKTPRTNSYSLVASFDCIFKEFIHWNNEV
jgi:hypothetical protein